MMQALHPMHLSCSTITMPLSNLMVAPVGHTSRHDGSSHCMHRTGNDCRTTFGNFPCSPFSSLAQKTPGGV